jgi:uncharacterized protein YerC
MSKKLGKMKIAEKTAVKASLEAAVIRLNNNADSFIDNLLTETERLTIGRRLLIANLILSGYTRMEINERLNVSPNMYAKIKRWLDDELPDFESTTKIERGRIKEKKMTGKVYLDPFSFAALQKKYPLHFLLFTLSKELIKRLES